MKKYVMECGCIRDREELKQGRVNNELKLRCPEHRKLQRSGIDHVDIICRDCGVKVPLSAESAYRRKRCDKCQDKHSKKLISEKNARVSQKEKERTKRKKTSNSIWDARQPQYKGV